MNGYLAGFFLAIVCFYLVSVAVRGLGNTLKRLGLWLITTGERIQNEQDAYGRRLQTRLARAVHPEEVA